VLVVAATGDPLFGFGYTQRVFDRIVAPAKELLVFEVDRHLLFNECVELVSDPLVDCIRRLVAAPGTAEMEGSRVRRGGLVALVGCQGVGGTGTVFGACNA
jgi:hypothetical protein